MKRSRSMKLVLMATTALLVAGCNSEESVEVTGFNDLEQCIASGDFTEAECKESYAAAKEYHEKSAPRYDSFKLCEEQHGIGSCGRSESGGDFFTPFLMGYVVSNMFSGTTHMHDSRDWESRVRPVYRTKAGGLATSSGYSLSRNKDGQLEMPKSSVTSKPKAAKVQTRTSVVSRGGFGGRSYGGSRGG
ncbi:DUF1190 domain-containing protein [Roseibium sp. RKSG952]|uniref:DUF1190 domain-containing protein n=1 Tax=Roseibium sp. RKSG952 TaxID=2529384 RepID=UPI0012BD5488|nr:DUF1190 domain-containing protein [Roseibium sp. RKSG952]MTH96141.1 DUF1190 domain-containing protein [Roseibium sp. RKSG952]